MSNKKRLPTTLSLTGRILAVNIFVLVLLAGSLFYIDNYRNRLIDERRQQTRLQSMIISESVTDRSEEKTKQLVIKYALNLKARIRIYDKAGNKRIDSFDLAEPGFILKEPEKEPFRKDVARMLDRSIEFLVGASSPSVYQEPKVDQVSAWPEALEASRSNTLSADRYRHAPDRTPMISAAQFSNATGETVFLMSNARDITRIVRDERASVGLVISLVTILSVFLSLFLARTIVKPIRRLASAAIRVRQGRASEVAIPNLDDRRDEIGQLAQSLSTMSGALRQRIDFTEAFAADVSHEIKNPLASLRSALEGLDTVQDAKLRQQLIDIAKDDVLRINRLITDISDASKVDAELARADFELIDIGGMIEQLLASREQRDVNKSIKIAFARPARGLTHIMGSDLRLERVFSNLLDNAVSFSPKNGVVEILASTDEDHVIVRVSDQGPGIAPEQIEKIFRRFHSDRPESEAFGKHSGLGLSIARDIVEGHGGTLQALEKKHGETGACFEVSLPLAEKNDTL